MSFKSLEADNQTEASEFKLPLIRYYIKEQEKLGNTSIYETPLVVTQIDTTRAGDKLRLTTEVCVALLDINDKLAQNITNLLTGLSGLGNAMCILPQKQNRRGFTVGVEDTKKVLWVRDFDSTYTLDPKTSNPPIQRELTLADFALALPELIEDGKRQTPSKNKPVNKFPNP